MLNLKSAKKGEIATLLTLGLVIVGAVITLASSFFINRQKNLVSNPRAATSCKVNVGMKCGSGKQWDCTTANGCDPTTCKTQDLEFNCCVLNYGACSDGSDKYRWYGCTGQFCQNQTISQGSGGPGHLVACQSGVGPGKAESCPATAATATPAANTPTPTPGSKAEGTVAPTRTPTVIPKLGGKPSETPTPFCQNINIPEIHTGIIVGLANNRGEGETLSVDDIINGLIRLKIKSILVGVTTLEDVRVRLTKFIGETILQGMGQALTGLAEKIALTPTMYFKINDILIPTPISGLNNIIKIVGVILRNNGLAYTLVSTGTDNFVNSVINNICQ